VPDRLAVADRLAILAELERLADNANQPGGVLDGYGTDKPAVAASRMWEDAARLLAAAAWVLETPIRRYIPGMVPTADGHPNG
jgi:hypothetical protein